MTLLIARIDAFTKVGRYVGRGQTVSSDEVEYDADDKNSAFIEAPEGVDGTAVVEIAAIAPTGPNPQNPQQIAPDVIQTPGGYEQSGARLVGEVTLPEKQRIEIVGINPEDDTQAKVTAALDKAGAPDGNLSNEPVDGTVADVTARIGNADAAELDRIEAAENDREVPRKGVISAIDRARAQL